MYCNHVQPKSLEVILMFNYFSLFCGTFPIVKTYGLFSSFIVLWKIRHIRIYYLCYSIVWPPFKVGGLPFSNLTKGQESNSFTKMGGVELKGGLFEILSKGQRAICFCILNVCMYTCLHTYFNTYHQASKVYVYCFFAIFTPIGLHR